MPSMLRVMNSKGDTTYEWDPSNPASVTLAQEQFQSFQSTGYRAARVNGDGTRGEFITEFDPSAGSILMVPPMRGG